MEDKVEKKFYSINLVAFIYMIVKELPKAYKDDTGLIYFVYPDSTTINMLINVYKRTKVQVDLHEYLLAFKQIRSLMANIK